jgi:hypothetical protein
LFEALVVEPEVVEPEAVDAVVPCTAEPVDAIVALEGAAVLALFTPVLSLPPLPQPAKASAAAMHGSFPNRPLSFMNHHLPRRSPDTLRRRGDLPAVASA